MNWLGDKLEISYGENSSLKPMEGLRGGAVFLVFLVHYCAAFGPYVDLKSYTVNAMNVLQNIGHSGVDLFFVLSGFLIYGGLINRKSIKFFSYIKRRINRIYPTFLTMFLIYLVLSFVFPQENKIPKGIAEATLYLTQNLLLLPGIFDINPMITVAWSLSYEILYYLLIPLLIFTCRLAKRNYLTRIYFWFFVSVVCFFIFNLWGGPDRLMMFIAGIILFEVKNNNNFVLPKYSGTYALLAALIIYAIQRSYGILGTSQTIILYLLFFILCLEAFSVTSGTAKWLCFKPLRYLGNMSYSYYLMHGLTLKAIILLVSYKVMPDHQFSVLFWFVLPISFFITLIPSFCLFIFVEKPFSLDRKRNQIKK